MRFGISYSSVHLIMVFLIKIARKITAFNKICTHHQYLKKKKKILWNFFKKSRQYGIRQNGLGNMVFGNLVLIHNKMVQWFQRRKWKCEKWIDKQGCWRVSQFSNFSAISWLHITKILSMQIWTKAGYKFTCKVVPDKL
jgi:hypothetical protein